MTATKRPGGLTGLAVVNFVFGCLAVIGSAGLLVLPMMLPQAQQATAQVPLEEAQRTQLQALAELGTTPFYALALANLVSAALLIASGVGYLQLKKFLGRTVGNASAVFGILSTVGTVFAMPTALGGGINLGTMIGLIYPALTLFLLNVTFESSFVK